MDDRPCPTAQEFADQLDAWAFTVRKTESFDIVLRGPGGGTLRIFKRQFGRADQEKVTKAAGILGVSVEEFWAGPKAYVDNLDALTQPLPPKAPLPSLAETLAEPAARSNRTGKQRDTTTAKVLSTHAHEDRPLSFDDLVGLCSTPGHKVTREQVSSASSKLASEGDLVRIRSGVYQWADGRLRSNRSGSPVASVDLRLIDVTEAPAPQPVQPSAPPPTPKTVPTPKAPQASTSEPPPVTASELFGFLCPDGLTMDGERLADYERWAALTNRFAELGRRAG